MKAIKACKKYEKIIIVNDDGLNTQERDIAMCDLAYTTAVVNPCFTLNWLIIGLNAGIKTFCTLYQVIESLNKAGLDITELFEIPHDVFCNGKLNRKLCLLRLKESIDEALG
tara:strand:- start:17 stop:352 length:336 start_codon:yes stop_codon:yes gene_type:complete